MEYYREARTQQVRGNALLCYLWGFARKHSKAMGRIVAIDYGKQRVGMAVTDPLQRIATPLTTVPTTTVMAFLQAYLAQEAVDTLVVGLPKHLNNTASPMTAVAQKFAQKLQRAFPHQQVRL